VIILVSGMSRLIGRVADTDDPPLWETPPAGAVDTCAVAVCNDSADAARIRESRRRAGIPTPVRVHKDLLAGAATEK
jgi:hypothetical protein